MTQTELTPTASQTGKWKPYPAYKDSEVEWLGKIPEHWEIKRLKFFAHVNMGQSPDSNDYNLNNLGVPFLQGNAEFGHVHPEPKIWCENARKFANPMDILLSVRAPVGQMNISDQTYGIGRGLCAITGQCQIDRNYFWFLLKVIREELACISTGSTYDAVSVNEVKRLVGLVPPLIEQKTIASFLDRETDRINALVAKKERLIKLLQEKRAALISHAVTKGLDPMVPMRDSGVEWIGKIPAHWEIKRVRNVTELLQTGPFGSQLHSSDYSSSGIPVINPSHLKDGRIYPDWDCTVDDEFRLRLVRHELHEGDIVFARRGEMGRCALVTEIESGWLCGTGSLLMRPRVTLTVPSFLNKVLSTDGVKDWLSEQQSIIDFIDHETAKIDALVSKIREGIEKLKEYSAALLSAAVTGKIDVRDEIALRDDGNL